MRPSISAVCRVALSVLGLVMLVASPRAQQGPALSYALVINGPLTVDDELTRAAREGYRCAAVARPTAPLLPNNVGVILSRPAAPASGAVQEDITVVVAKAGLLQDFERDVNKVAATGFRMCGFTITAPVWAKVSTYMPVAVMTRTIGAPAESRSYRVLRTQGRSGQWAALEKSAADGFAVTHLVSRPESATSDISGVVFVAERTDTSPPLEYRLVFAGNAVALQKELEKAAAFRVQAVWNTGGRVSVLLARPTDGGQSSAHEYKVDDPSTLRISSLDGELLKLLRFKDGAIGLYDRRRRVADYSLLDGVVADPPNRPDGRVVTVRSERWLVAKLDADGGRGFSPLDFTWRLGPDHNLLVDVVLIRPSGR